MLKKTISTLRVFGQIGELPFQLLAALLITRQVVGNLKESLLPYATKHLKVINRTSAYCFRIDLKPILQMAKMSFDLFGALSPTDGEGESKVLDQNCANGKYHQSRTSGNRRRTEEEEGRRQ